MGRIPASLPGSIRRAMGAFTREGLAERACVVPAFIDRLVELDRMVPGAVDARFTNGTFGACSCCTVSIRAACGWMP